MNAFADDRFERERSSARAGDVGVLCDAARRAQDAMVELAVMAGRVGVRDVADVLCVQEMTSTAIGMAAAVFQELGDQLAAQLARDERDWRGGAARRAQAAPSEAVRALRRAARDCTQLAESTAVLPGLPGT